MHKTRRVCGGGSRQKRRDGAVAVSAHSAHRGGLVNHRCAGHAGTVHRDDQGVPAGGAAAPRNAPVRDHVRTEAAVEDGGEGAAARSSREQGCEGGRPVSDGRGHEPRGERGGGGRGKGEGGAGAVPKLQPRHAAGGGGEVGQAGGARHGEEAG